MPQTQRLGAPAPASPWSNKAQGARLNSADPRDLTGEARWEVRWAEELPAEGEEVLDGLRGAALHEADFPPVRTVANRTTRGNQAAEAFPRRTG